MYYPYLRGKQFELIALREFAEKSPAHIRPIIEPVKRNTNSLITALSALVNKGMPFALVLNPATGEYRKDSLELDEIFPLLKEHDWTPAFLLNDNAELISGIIESYNIRNAMVIVGNGFNVDNQANKELLSDDRITFVVGAFESNRGLKRFFNSAGKKIIRLDDCFKEKQKNADYADNTDELFSEEFNYYSEEGYEGFSDYTALSSDFKEGGMLPKAVAIHMTYPKSEEAVYVHHFVSDSNDSTANIKKKFYEAALKLKDFFSPIPTTDGVRSVIECLDNDKYPGLGMLKKYSILNHLELMENILSSRV